MKLDLPNGGDDGENIGVSFCGDTVNICWLHIWLGHSVGGPVGTSHWSNQLPDLNSGGSRIPGTAWLRALVDRKSLILLYNSLIAP